MLRFLRRPTMRRKPEAEFCPPQRMLARGGIARQLYIVSCSSYEIPGLSASLDKITYHHGGVSLPMEKPHAFVYFVTIHNSSEHTVTLLGRKWVLEHADGSHLVIEGDKIIGETPRLAPGERFSYNSYHVTGCEARATGSFHGVDETGRKIHVVLPPFELKIPV